MTKLFISYSSKDIELVKRLAADLKELGHDVWLDTELAVGENILTTIEQKVSKADYLVVVLSQTSVASKWVKLEWQTKLWAEVEQSNYQILPVLIENCNIPEFLKKKHFADFRQNYSIGLVKLNEAINSSNQKQAQSKTELLQKNIGESSEIVNAQDKLRSAHLPESYNLPRPIEAFIKRESFFNEILRTLSPAFRGWGAAIDGMGGVGKTSLAIEVAHHCQRERAFQRIIWSTAQTQKLRSDYESLSTPSGQNFYELDGLLNEILRAFRHTDYEFLDPLEKQHIVRNSLGKEFTLLIIDNLETVKNYDAIADFLENTPVTTKVVTTTRNQQLGRGERRVQLPPMSFEETKQLIESLCQLKNIEVTQNQIHQLYEMVSGIPLAIAWSIGQFRRSPQRIDEFLNSLKRLRLTGAVEAHEKQILEFCFREAYKALSGNAAKMLKILGLISVPILSSDLEKTLDCGFGFEAARDEIIDKFSLVQEQLDENNSLYLTVLPWTRYFVRYELAKNENLRRELLLRYASYRVSSHLGTEYICAFTPDYRPIELPRGATTLDFAYHIHTDIGHEFNDARVNSKSAAISHTLQNGDVVEIITGNAQPHIRWLDYVRTGRAERSIIAWLKKPERARLNVRIANALSLKCEVDRAGSEYDRAIHLNPNSTWAQNKFGHHLRLLGDYEQAFHVFASSLSLQANNPYALQGIATIHYQNGRLADAINLYAKAISLKTDYENAIFGLSRCYCALGQYQEANDLLTQAANMPVHRRRRATLHLFLMLAQLGLGKADSAVNIHLSKALREFNRIVPKERLDETPYYGSHILYYYAITLACGSSKHYSSYLKRAAEVCSLSGLINEALMDLKCFKPRLLDFLQEFIENKFPGARVKNKVLDIVATLEKMI